MPSARSARDRAAPPRLRVGDAEVPLVGPEVSIGRTATSEILVNEPLVSRRHARILVDGARLFIEDLDSANGTFVNQLRLVGRIALSPGDHILIGTQEMVVVEAGDDDVESRNTPISIPTGSEASATPRGRGDESTIQADALDYAGRLADKMFTMGRIDAARRILADPIEEHLAASRSGK